MAFLAGFLGAKDETTVVQLGIVHLNILIYAASFWMTRPILPFLSKDLGADPVIFGYLQTITSLLLLIGSPVVGRICDTRGARTVVMLSHLGSALSYFFLGASTNLKMLFISRIPVVFQHAMHSSQVCVTHLSLPKLRAQAIGRLSLTYGIGMVFGSLVGGLLSGAIGNTNVAFLASALSLAMLPIARMGLPDVKPEATPATADDGQAQAGKKGLGFAVSLQLISKYPVLRDLLALNMLVGFGLTVQRSTFSLGASEAFGMDPKDMGFVLSYAAGMGVLSNTFVVGWITARFSENGALSLGATSLTLLYLAYARVSTYAALLALMAPMSVASSLLYTVSASGITKAVSAQDAGVVLGLSHATRTLCGVLAPMLGGYVYKHLGFSSVGLVSAAFCALGAVLLQFGSVDRTLPKNRSSSSGVCPTSLPVPRRKRHIVHQL